MGADLASKSEGADAERLWTGAGFSDVLGEVIGIKGEFRA
jgi:hypothetical protein